MIHSHPSVRRSHHYALLLLFALSGCKEDLYTKLQERDANEMLALLLDNGVDAVRVADKDGTNTIQVEKGQVAFSIDRLNAKGLPRQAFKNLGEIFEGSGLIASPTEERARYVYALNEELSRTISEIDGVLSVRVHVVLPDNDLLREGPTPSSASVFVRHDANTDLSRLLPQIKMLIANSIEGLSYDKVEVVFVPVQRPPFEQRPDLAQSDKSIPAPLLAVAVSLGVAVLTALSYLVSTLVQRGKKSSPDQSIAEGRSRVSAIEVVRKMFGGAA
ncbi:type III secretion system inner membrane ring lipoprotein SctJ [Rhizobium etli]|uniref:type III secretion system inner membrane ring lipoprotein SctJ n=1 Tax=Rhizobium etli TaxID=29449 RepID=UPI00040E0883|nr:type III secretion inner membrane ring lipoprotein SctJ [Rhizobium etli]